MPEAKFQIKRKCEVCGNTFIAKTLDSRCVIRPIPVHFPGAIQSPNEA